MHLNTFCYTILLCPVPDDFTQHGEISVTQLVKTASIRHCKKVLGYYWVCINWHFAVVGSRPKFMLLNQIKFLTVKIPDQNVYL